MYIGVFAILLSWEFGQSELGGGVISQVATTIAGCNCSHSVQLLQFVASVALFGAFFCRKHKHHIKRLLMYRI